MATKTIPVKNGRITIPDELRAQFGIENDSHVVIEAVRTGILLRPAHWSETEQYTAERIAEFLLGNAVSDEDYQEAIEEVKRIGVDPQSIQRDRP